MKLKKNKIDVFPFVLIIMMIQTGCKKFVEVDPPVTQIAGSTVYSSNTSAASAMTGIYSTMIASSGAGLSSGQGSLGYLMGLAADELKNYSTTTTLSQFYLNSLSSSSGVSSNYYFWTELYNEIYVANAVIEGLENSTGVTPSVKRQLTGEAKFMRAFLHFYATNLYGDVPLVTSTDYQKNNTIRRSSVTTVQQQIVADLRDAETDLPENFVDGIGNSSGERIRPNRGAAFALLARVYLYQQKWDSAEVRATAVINNAALYNMASLDSAFLKNNNEAIWQLQPVSAGANTYDGYYFILTGPPGSGQSKVSISQKLTDVFEGGDARFTHWIRAYTRNNITYYYPYKYKIGVISTSLPVTEYAMVLRLAEQYLIRAEARAQKGNMVGANGAIADLNIIRHRAGLVNYAGPMDQDSVLKAIMHERQVELFTEWGHRWFDLKRTDNINSVMGSPGNVCASKGGSWAPDKALLPLPLKEIQINPNLTQNAGY